MGTKPVVSPNLATLEASAQAQMSAEAFAYIAGGAGLESTMSANRAAFARWQIVPRMLRDVSERDTRTRLLSQLLPAPLLLAPIGVLEMAHPQADLAVAEAAADLGVPYIFSNQASVPMERCAAAMGSQPHWFQLYWSKSNDLVASFVQRAEACGCGAIVVTLDTTMLGWRSRDLALGHLPFLQAKGIAQYLSDPVFQQLVKEFSPGESALKPKVTAEAIRNLVAMVGNYPGSFWANLRSGEVRKAVQLFMAIYSRPSLTWNELAFLRQHTRLPILLKGILHPDDARQALDHGMDGLIVSNHGGRQVDGAIGTLDALPGIVAAVQGQIPILLDSGIRSGADMFKALALGATAVCLGRPYCYGLALAGRAGVAEVIRHLMADFELTMGLAGCKNVAEITSSALSRNT